MKKGIFLLLALVLGGMCLVAGCQADRGSAGSSVPTGASQEKSSVYFMAGRIEAGEKADISSKINARVLNVQVGTGSVVKKGDPLIQLDSRDLKAQTDQADAALSQAQAAIKGARAGYANAQSSNGRNQKLFNAGAISKSQWEQSQTELASAESALKTAQAQVDQAQAALELASTLLGNGIIVSPISGIISAQNINAGELAVAGVQMFTVVNTDSLSVNAYLPASLVNEVKTGQDVVVKVSEVPARVFNGQISVIDAVVDSKNNNILVKVRLTDQDSLLKPGMFAEIGLK